MDVSIKFSDGRVMKLNGVDDDWSWEDLFDLLYDSGKISDEEYSEIEEHVNIGSRIQESLDVSQTGGPSKSHTLRKASGESVGNLEDGDTSSNLQSEEALSRADMYGSKSNRRRLGASKPTEKSKPKSGLSRRKSTPKEIQNPKAEPILKRTKSKKKRPNQLIKGKHYIMQVQCSHSKKSWSAVLFSLTEPETFKISKSKAKKKKSEVIHLVLDDSGSMEWGDAIKHLKTATVDFLENRNSSDRIFLHTLNDSSRGPASGGAPQDIIPIVRDLKTPGSTPMKECFSRIKGKIGSGHIVIFFTDGGPTTGDPTPEVGKIKSKGARMITIGCGDGADAVLLKKLASDSPSGVPEYYHAKSSANILQVFKEVEKSLAQRTSNKIISNNKLKNSGSAKQVKSFTGKGKSNSDSQMGELSSNQGFGVIDDFECHHCKSDQRLVCGNCNSNVCGGGVSDSKLTCPSCKEISEVEETDKVMAKASGNLGAKGKGK